MAEPLFTNDINTQQNNNSEPESLEDTLTAQRSKWTKEVESLNEMMKDLPKIDELLNIVYAKRQNCVEYYYAMNNVILKQSKEYKKLYNDMFNNIKINGYNGMRFSSDQLIGRQVETELQDRKELIDMLSNQNSFIKDTISTIDNIIFGINQKVKVKEMLNGLKF